MKTIVVIIDTGWVFFEVSGSLSDEEVTVLVNNTFGPMPGKKTWINK